VHLPIILLGPYSDELIDSVTPQHNDYIFTPPKARLPAPRAHLKSSTASLSPSSRAPGVLPVRVPSPRNRADTRVLPPSGLWRLPLRRGRTSSLA
jgi:hypothetical protein